jgi:hypothetical protein
MKATRREVIAGLAAGSFLSGCKAAVAADAVTPESFGAKGDGRTNDTDAFAAMSAHVNSRGGGTIVLRPVTYIVGKQAHTPGANDKFGFTPADIIHISGCSAPVAIQGNGAKIRCAAGLRYGGFDPQSGRPLPDSRDNLKSKNRAVPYLGIILIENCTGSVDISDLEVDGNLSGLVVGGRYARAGWQAAGSGIRLIGNSGAERLSRIHSHHHAQDGLYLKSTTDRTTATTVSDCVAEYNGRQGCTILGGRNYSFERCRFIRTGRAGIQSLPRAGVDIEAEGGGTIRNVAFSDCEFSDNAGFAMVAGSGDSADATFTRCKFVGTTNWAAWPNKPGFRFSNCTFVGQIVHVYGDPDPARAAQFMDCTFSDNPALSPTGQVYGGRIEAKPIAILTKSQNALFNRCNFNLAGDMTLPMSTDVIYSDCTMTQRSPMPSRPGGTYLGRTTISGNANLTGSHIRGTVTLNGRPLPPTA